MPTPKLPIVAAIAPNAPIGAVFMMMPTMPNSTLRQPFDELEHRRAGLAGRVEREAEEHREQQHLQDVGPGERVDDARRNDAEQEIRDACRPAGGDVLRDRLRSSVAGSTFIPRRASRR